MQPVQTEVGTVEMHTLSYSNADIALILGYSEYPEVFIRVRPADSLLTNARKGAVSNVRGKLVLEKPIQYGTFPGREIHIRVPGRAGLLRARYYLVGNRLCQMIVAGPDSVALGGVGNRFLDSFRLKEGAGDFPTERLLKALGYTYELNENRQYRLVINFDDGRSQVIMVTPTMTLFDSRSAYDVWSGIMTYQGTLSPEVADSLLVRNGEVDIGSYQSLPVEEGKLLVFSSKVTGEQTREGFRNLLLKVASEADEMEKHLTGEDEY